MSGSMTYRQYTSDNGASYSIKCDESNASAVVQVGAGTPSAALLPVRVVSQPGLPKGLKPRYVNTFNIANPNQKRRFQYTTSVQVAILAAGATIKSEDYPAGGGLAAGVVQTWAVTSSIGEKLRLPPAFNAVDTGLTDGTVSQ